MLHTKLRLDWCSHEAAKHACLRFHYARSIPGSSTVKIGVWEDDRFVGAVIFSHGATPAIGSPYGLGQDRICELTRIALTTHKTPVSRILSIALRMLRSHCPGLRLIVSFADCAQGHHGGIYQATNWVYAGSVTTGSIRLRGELVHPKSVVSTYGTQKMEWLRANLDPYAERVKGAPKHRYLLPLDREMTAQIEKLRQPYPKRQTMELAA